jgi:chemotaxis regulatin CheY-phosphate phosphatase CheZ
MPSSLIEWMEFLSYVVTVVGLPLAIYVFLVEQRKERGNEEEETYQRLSDEYSDFLKLVIENSDLRLLSHEGTAAELTPEQLERKQAIFAILIALFERAYILVYEENLDKQQQRLWQSWEDYMREWCERRDFREALPELLEGEDPDFAKHIYRLVEQTPIASTGAEPGSAAGRASQQSAPRRKSVDRV